MLSLPLSVRIYFFESSTDMRKALEKLPVVRKVVHVNPEQLPEGRTLDDFRPLGTPEIVPLYRQEKVWGRSGFAIARSVMCNLFHRAAEVLKPIYELLIALVVAHPHVNADETKRRLAEPKQARDGWIWTLPREGITA